MGSFGLVLTVLILSVIWRISGQRQCPRLSKPWNGQFIGSCNSYVGSQCVMQCRTPYILVGSSVRECRSGGTWSGSTTSCPLDGCDNCEGGSNCPNIYNPDNGHTEELDGCENCEGGSNSNCPSFYNPNNGCTEGQWSPGIVGQACRFRCNRGYSLEELDGCENCGGGSNSNCPSIYNPDNGYTEGPCSPGIVGHACRFRCNRGYSLEGLSQLTCLNGGQWSSREPHCRMTVAAICEEIVVQNGYVSCTQQGGLTVCSVTCDEAFMIVGSSVVTCSSSGDWSDQVPSCRRSGTEVTNVCPTLNAPDGGRLVGSCTAANTGDTCQLVCLSGYRPTDTRVLICQTTGRWSNSLPRCTGGGGSGCPRISISQASISEECFSSSTGQTCRITCNSGYTLTGGSGNLVCQSNGQWSDSIPICAVALSCPALAAPSGGSSSGTCTPGQAGQTCNFYCNSGYRLVGQSTLICGNDGRWSGNPPYCIGATCPSLDTPANGARSGTCSGATVGQSCSFSCQAGYILNGQSTVYCQAGGTWSSSAATCTRSSCPTLYPPNSGTTSGSCSQASVGQSCTFSCNSGYTLSGQSTLYCQQGGSWSSSTPSCIRTGTTNDGNCPVLTPPPNGEFVDCDNRRGGQCIVVCERGFVRSGSRTRTCLSQGTWSGYAPTCTRTDCCS